MPDDDPNGLCPLCQLAGDGNGQGHADVDEYVDRVARELHDRVEQQRDLMKHLLRSGVRIEASQVTCPLANCPRLESLRAILQETIETLEATRSAFKSKRLEVMRKKLTNVLIGS